MRKLNLLSVDWDFFFPIKESGKDSIFFDWGHKENEFMITVVWPIRALTFLRNKKRLPRTSGEESDFWSRFNFSSECVLYYTESHSRICSLKEIERIKSIVSFDAHHDAGYKDDDVKNILKTSVIHCDNWMVYFSFFLSKMKVIYPKWRDYAMDLEPIPQVSVKREVDTGGPLEGTFDIIFLCRSGAWSPPWLDKKFSRFIKDCPVKRKILLDKIIDRSDWRTLTSKTIKVEKNAYERTVGS